MNVNRMTYAMLLALVLLAGCDNSITDETGQAPGSVITPRRTWRVMGDVQNPAQAIDGSISTAATASGNYDNASITIDLGKPCIFNLIQIEHGSDEQGYARRASVLVSIDGEKYERVAEAPGTRKVTNINLITPTLARYVRIQANISGPRPWSIAEIVIH